MTVTALWIPFEVTGAGQFDATARFYRDLLALPETDRWTRDGEDGAVYAAGPAGRIEVVHPASPPSGTSPPFGTSPPSRTGAPPIALELPDRPAVDALYDRLSTHEVSATKPATFPRGHYGFTATDPAGNAVLLWSEAKR